MYQTVEEIQRFIDEFEQCTLPGAQWTHIAHLTVALWYLSRLPEDEATHRIRSGIQAYNASRGIASTPTGGYHETITLFYIRLIRHYLHEAPPNTPFPELLDGLLRNYGHKRLLAQYYSRSLLLSPKARSGWVEPDLRRLE